MRNLNVFVVGFISCTHNHVMVRLHAFTHCKMLEDHLISTNTEPLENSPPYSTYSGTPLKRPPLGPKLLAVIYRGRFVLMGIIWGTNVAANQGFLKYYFVW